MELSDLPEHEIGAVRIELTHGVVQQVCDESRVDALHIKGMALDPSLRHPGRQSRDVDLLVRPAHIDTFRDALRAHGWQQRGRFITGSPFEHAENWHHDKLGYLDLHRLIPGIGLSPSEAFESMWSSRRSCTLARVSCAVPSLTTQALVILLHAARSHGEVRALRDIDHVWHSGEPSRRQAIDDLVAAMHAEVAFAAAVGGLEQYRNRPDYLLWKVNSSPNADRTTEWWARIRAASGVREKATLLVRSLLVNRDHLRALRNHEPTRTEILREFVTRVRAAAREVAARRRRR